MGVLLNFVHEFLLLTFLFFCLKQREDSDITLSKVHVEEMEFKG